MISRFFKELSFDRILFLISLTLFVLSLPIALFHTDYPSLSFIERPRSGLHLTERFMDASGFPRQVALDEMRLIGIAVSNPSLAEKDPPPPRKWNIALMKKPFLSKTPLRQPVNKAAAATLPAPATLPMKNRVVQGETVGKRWRFVGLVKTEREGGVRVVLQEVESNRHHLLHQGEEIGGLKVEEVVFHTAILVSQDGQRWTLTTQPGESTLFTEGGY